MRTRDRWLVLALLLATTAYALAEELTLTTYYPSPRGVYDQLKTMGQTLLAQTGGSVGIGMTTAPAARLHVTRTDDAGPVLRLDDQAADLTPVVVDPNGNVGIGMVSPTQKLDVAGYVRGQNGLCIGDDCRTEWPLKTIMCRQSGTSPGGPAYNGYMFRFSASDCGGTLPDATYDGVIKTTLIDCGFNNLQVLNAGETPWYHNPPANGGPGPGIIMYNPSYFCGVYLMEVLYIKH